MSKPKILIVDDSQLNREILACMLEDKYDICEAENGKQAVEILERCHKDFKLVLLDLIMPVMDGYQVLAVMKEKQWLDMLPVICISSETSEDSIRRVYGLGASDYFTRPFDAMTVFHRVESTIALHDKMTGDLQDAMKMLSSIFHRILKINLSTDTYTVIRGKDSTVSMLPSLSESLKMMADYKYIYEEDQEEYLKFCSIDNLRRELAKGRERIYLNYRTLIKQEYRWVCMEVIRSAEYKPDDQIAMMYIRDINDEYLKQLDKIIRHAKDAFASVTVNISDGSCIMANSRIASLELKDVNEPLDSYIERISQSIPQREVRTQYRKVFCVDNLRECLTQGKDMIQWECPVYAAKGISLRMIRTTVEMVRNVSYDRLEALIYFSDITENYFSEQIPHMLYRKNFDRIEIIDGQRDCVRLDHPGICAMEMVLAEEISYSGYVTEVMKKFVPDDEKSVYEKCVRLDTIRKELQEKDRYSFSVHQFNKKGDIPALEESGHISELDLYVLDSVNEFQKKRYQSDKITVPVSTNLSWMDFYDETIMNWLEKKCADASMPSGLCRMEITETSYAAIEADRNATLEALREAGILLLLDDFGSGYSSFGMLQNYNFDIMKIDMSFVRQIETNTKTRSIIRFIIEMAHTMDIKIIAEGAETKEQVEFLRDNGCDYIQGYYFYKPMPEEEFVKLLDAGR